jgi:LmbE family N-acetylglucosaminyl deacetylase
VRFTRLFRAASSLPGMAALALAATASSLTPAGMAPPAAAVPSPVAAQTSVSRGAVEASRPLTTSPTSTAPGAFPDSITPLPVQASTPPDAGQASITSDGGQPSIMSDAGQASITSVGGQPSISHATGQSLTAPAAPGCATTLNVVAHEDDDLLFINPSVSQDIAAGRCVVTLFVTAGDAGRPGSYWRGREQGAMDAYAAMAGVLGIWRADEITLAGHVVHRFRLTPANVTLLFLRLPDAHGAPGRPVGTLKELWLGSVTSLYTLDTNSVYTRQSLINTLTAAMNAYRPGQIRTLDYAGHYNDGDHEDHHTVGYLTLAAQGHYRVRHRITAYMGYEVSEHPDNLDPDTADTKLNYFLAYAPHDTRVCQSADACWANFYAPRFSHSIKTASS